MEGRTIRAVMKTTSRKKCVEAALRDVDMDNMATVFMGGSRDINGASEEPATSDYARRELHGSDLGLCRKSGVLVAGYEVLFHKDSPTGLQQCVLLGLRKPLSRKHGVTHPQY